MTDRNMPVTVILSPTLQQLVIGATMTVLGLWGLESLKSRNVSKGKNIDNIQGRNLDRSGQAF